MDHDPSEPPQMLTLDEAAERLRVSPRTLRSLIAAGAGPPVTRLGRMRRGRILLRNDLLAAWVRDHTRQGGAASPPNPKGPLPR